MVERQGKNWGLRAAICAAVVAWQIYDMVSARLTQSSEGDTLRLVVIGAALFGLVFSLVRLSVDY